MLCGHNQSMVTALSECAEERELPAACTATGKVEEDLMRER